MERLAWLLTVKFDSCNNLYHPFILIVSFCVLSSLTIKHENIIGQYYARKEGVANFYVGGRLAGVYGGGRQVSLNK